MCASRNIWLTIGKKNYSVETTLAPGAVERIESLVAAACDSPAKGIEQEELLMLTCLQLAYSLDKAASALEGLLKKVE